MKRYNSSYWIVLFLLFLHFSGNAQSQIDKLKAQQNQLDQQIRQSQNKIKKYTKIIKKTSGKLLNIQQKLKTQEHLLQLRQDKIKINKELLRQYISELQYTQKKSTDIRQNFDQRINSLYMHRLKNKNKINTTLINPNSKILQNLYVNQYHTRTKNMLEQLKELSNQLDSLQNHHNSLLLTNQSELQTLKKQKKKLTEQKKEFNTQLKKAQKNKKKISKQITSQKKARALLQHKIIEAIKNNSDKKIDIKLSDNFEENQGLFRPPLDASVIVSPFGEQSHPLLPGIKIFNNGVDLASEADTQVKAIFDGTVLSIQQIPAAGIAVIIQHGYYYSVYSKLSSVSVHLGDQVLTTQVIGQLPKSDENVLHFELWKNQQKLNPEMWLKL